MEETEAQLSFTLMMECSIPKDVHNILVDGEEAVAAYKTFRDKAIFTTRRLIIRDVQGMTGTKVEMYSIPYTSIEVWSVESSGILDIDSEVEIWTRNHQLKIKLRRGINVRKFEQYIAEAVLF